ncbi:MAG TPA: cyanophycin synthetase, partial [Anaeromyxobacter sp.]|nr:cyanophycin synthetase [Anaeromyxobacter sp.]
SPQEIAAGLAAFRGVKRRQEVRGTAGGVTVVDDFAHHPRAVEKTLAAIQGTHPGARLLAAFEPRSNTSRRNLHQREYAAASTWGTAAEVFLLRPAPTDRVPESERLDLEAVTRELSASGKPARAFATVDEMVPAVVAASRPGDVVVAMSNGAFGGIWGKLLEALAAR